MLRKGNRQKPKKAAFIDQHFGGLMKNRLKRTGFLLLSAGTVSILYILLHELGHMVVMLSAGLAEVFAANMFGEERVGKWVRETTPEMLREIVKPLVCANLMTSDFQKLSSYLYGDEIMALRGDQPIGMPYCGGYACGYALIGHYLKKTGVSIYEATITPTEEILKQTEDFWK